MFVDLGVYGFSHIQDFEGRDKTLRKFERFTLKHNGFQALYAETLLNYEEFCKMFPRVVYDQVMRSVLNKTDTLACLGKRHASSL